MPEAQRAYVDFQENYPNFYVYYGYKSNIPQATEGANTFKGIEQICTKNGLLPVEIQSKR
jgi:hypothetical protein